MTPKEELNNIWRDSYPKAREKWSADRFRKHWYIVQKAIGELEELKKDVARFMTMNEFSSLFTNAERKEYMELWKKLTKAGKE